MRQRVVVLLSSLALPAALGAQTGSAPAPSATPSPEPPKLSATLSGFFEFNAYSQTNFFLGRGAPGLVSDEDRYSIQMFRIQPELAYGPDLKAVLRLDMAQGIWGIDDEPRDAERSGFSNLFNRKDTNFLVHLDWAYIEATPPALGGWTVRVGRMKNQLGNLLVLDQDGDGVQAQKKLAGWRLLGSWTKMSEGADSLTDAAFPGGLDGKDADLFYLDVAGQAGGWQLNPFLAYYLDRAKAGGATYVPNGLQYFRPRFTPNLSRALVLGAAFSGKAGALALKGEAEYLTGKDDVPNPNSGPRELLDVNDGELRGFNVYLDARYELGSGTLGAVLGLGSGDDDPLSGKGNINKIRTNGFFYVTEVWEDSIMPDEEGITPQGLGSPASRGYRELENTTLLQLSYARQLDPRWRLLVSATLVRATQALRPWSDLDGNGAIDPGELGAASSKDLGRELDALLDWSVMPNLVWTLRGGLFDPGDASGYLINGTAAFLKTAWELRTALRFSFSGKAF